jgi:multidrug efflux pump subunit AcrB
MRAEPIEDDDPPNTSCWKPAIGTLINQWYARGERRNGPDLETMEKVALEVDLILKQIDSVEASDVIADRSVGKRYIEINIDRDAFKRYGLYIRTVQDVNEAAIGESG